MAATLINTMRGADGTVVVEIRGEIDVANADRVRQVLLNASRQQPVRLVVDLLHATFIDSTGIGALVAGCHAARELGVPLRIRQPGPFIEAQLR